MLKFKENAGPWSPLTGLRKAGATAWVIDGLLPQQSIAWLVAPPESFKSFVALDMSVAVAAGRDWHGRATEPANVIYVAAEGGADIHVRRAGAEIAAGASGPLAILQTRPRLDEPMGLTELKAVVALAAPLWDAQPAYTVDYAAYVSQDIKDALWERAPLVNDPYDLAGIEKCTDEDWVNEHIENLAVPLLSETDRIKHQLLKDVCADPPHWAQPASGTANVLAIIDTYSQTSADDTKPVVSRYVKTLRDTIEWGETVGISVTIIVLDHMTKSGDSYMGALAKQADSDAMFLLKRRGQNVTLICDRLKMAEKFEPIHLTLEPIEITGYLDKQGRPLTTLRVVDGQRAHQLLEAVGAKGDTAAAQLLGLLGDEAITTQELRERFRSLTCNEGAKPETVNRNFLRVLRSLVSGGILSQVSGVVKKT